MTPNLALSAPPTGAAVACALLAHGSVRLTAEAVAALRQNPPTAPSGPLPGSFLKNADEQTVAAVAAVLQAIDRGRLDRIGFGTWGVVGAPRFLGRQALAIAVARFGLEGAWGVSPHLIPHRSVHAVSGTISQVLASHGPNLGVGGGPESASEALSAAAALTARGELPGLWVVLTGCDPEQHLDRAGHPEGTRASVWNAVAFAVTAGGHAAPGPRLVVHSPTEASPRGLAVLRVEALQEALTATGPSAAWRLASGGWAELRGLNCRAES